MFFIRPIQRADLDAVLALSEHTGAGLTSLPANADRLATFIGRSVASFAGEATRIDECYMFALVEARSGNVVGVSGIEAAVGLREPWYNYHVGTQVHASRELDVYTAAPTLFLTNDHTGCSELCSLFVDVRYRRGKNGSLLSKSRLLFVADFADRFAPKLIADLRGRSNEDGKSPFWEGLGRHFFAMDYSRADYLTGLGDKSFIAELMPRHPVYTVLLPEDARAVIGEVHDATVPARALLESEGFRYEGYVDIFDAGPTLECFRDDVRLSRRSQLLPVSIGEADAAVEDPAEDVVWLVSNRRYADFAALLCTAPRRPLQLALLPYQARTLGVRESDIVRAVPLSPRDRV
jgi:arginine N-succinyltransferase